LLTAVRLDKLSLVFVRTQAHLLGVLACSTMVVPPSHPSPCHEKLLRCEWLSVLHLNVLWMLKVHGNELPGMAPKQSTL